MIAIITGASSGLGAEFARQLDSEGLSEIWLVARDLERLDKVGSELKTRTKSVVCDLSSSENIESIMGTLLKNESPDVKYCINNAGFGKIGPLHKLNRSDMTGMVDVNCRAVVQLTHMVVPYMKSGAAFIQTSSAASYTPIGGFAVYAATKSFVTSFSVAIQAELQELGIHSIAFCPGPIETDFSRRAHEGSVRKDSVMKKKADAAPAVRKAINDAKRKRTISLYGIAYHLMALFTRFIPQKFLADVSYKKVMNKK